MLPAARALSPSFANSSPRSASAWRNVAVSPWNLTVTTTLIVSNPSPTFGAPSGRVPDNGGTSPLPRPDHFAPRAARNDPPPRPVTYHWRGRLVTEEGGGSTQGF